MKNPTRAPGLRILMLALFTHTFLVVSAQDVRILPAVSRSYAITQVTVIQGPGRKVEGATVVIKDGLITAVGKGVAIPSDAIQVKGDSLYVYPGFIDGLSRTGVNKPREDVPKEKPKDPGNPLPESAGITPYQDVRSFLNPLDKSIEEWRALGFTVIQVVPYGGMLPGSAAVISLTGTADKMVMVPGAALYAELTTAERVYPNTILGLLAKWKELYRQAQQAKSYATLYASNHTGVESPGTDRVLEAFYPVIDKKAPVLFKAEKNLDVQRILSLKNQLGFNVLLAEVKEGWDLIPSIKASGASVFLSLELPEEKKEKEKIDKEKLKDDQAIVPDSLERKALEKRKADFTALYVAQALAFQNAGVPFGFSSLSVKIKDVQPNLRRIIKAGLKEDDVLAALTTNPAKALGISDRVGSIDPGKIANLVISRKPYFDEKAKVKYVFVEGKLYKVEPAVVEKTDAEKKSEKP
ncbi:MAG TPA: amidohydrolase family protein [Chryseolinea sp.]|nr:amidohydrolase family protein [Chryseolinea sp.]